MYLKCVTLLLSSGFSILISAQSLKQAAWQQHVAYNIAVTLDDQQHKLSGRETIQYTNNAPHALTELWFHLWPNAYQDRNTPFARQQLEQGKTAFHFAPDSLHGHIEGLAFTVDGIPVTMTPDPDCDELCRIILRTPLQYGETITIETPFTVQIPGQFSRFGHVWQDYQITQWYPKPAVYDVNGWNTMPYLDQGEFYSEFGSFEVSITLPGSYAVGATGVLQNEEDRFQNSKPMKTLVWKQDSIHDFAWFANKEFIISHDTTTLSNGHTVNTYGYYPPSVKDKKADAGKVITDAIATALKYYSERVGYYPYTSATAVIGPLFAGGGMEYPMITICQGADADVIIHEVGHNWFYGMLGSNERRYPWMDESINTFYENACQYGGKTEQVFQYRTTIPNVRNWLGPGEEYFLYLLQARKNEDQPVDLAAPDYTGINYGASIYAKGPLLFKYLNVYLGDTLFNNCMHAYFNAYKYKHPLPKDMQTIFERVAGQPLDWFFTRLLSTDADIDLKPGKTKDQFLLFDIRGKSINGAFPEIKLNNNIRHKPLKIAIPGNFENPGVTQINLCPVAAYNLYDQWQFGGLIYNRLAPVKKTEYLLMPMYSTGSKSVSGYAKLQFNLPVNNARMYRADAGINTATFSFKPEDAMTQYYRVNPNLTLHFRHHGKIPKTIFNRLSLDLSMIKLKSNTYTSYDTIHKPINIPYLKGHAGYFGRISYTYDNRFVLNPVSLTTTLEYGNTPSPADIVIKNANYLKLSTTLDMEFKYKQKHKKFKMRLFAGTFLHNNNTSGIQYFRLSGNTGAYDYLYQQALIGRSENTFNNSIFNRQLITKDGNMRTSIPTTLITNGWMLAGNFETTLPGFIPFRLYADAGVAGKPLSLTQNMNHKSSYIGYAYTCGAALVIKENVFEIYFPFAWSKNFQDYFNSQPQKLNYGQKMSFKLNLNLLNPFDLVKGFSL